MTKDALEKLGAWEKAQPKLAMTENVRAAFTLVARGEAVLGIVYATDAKAEPNVKIVGTFPPDFALRDHLSRGATVSPSRSPEHLAFLRSPAAKAIFERYGFTFLPKPGS